MLGEGEGQVIGEEEDPLGTVEGGEGLPESMGASGGAADGGDVEILPFTGMVAALVIGAGLVALLLGLMARAAAERLRRA